MTRATGSSSSRSPDDPIAAAEGALAEEFGALDPARLRREARADERVAEARRRR
jgi:hypothetical protein